jgi:ribosomal protein L11 methyltransferase
MNYIQLEFTANTDLTEIITAHLMEEGFEGTEDVDGFTKTYIKEDQFNEVGTKALFDKYELPFKTLILPGKNWNAEWEANFQPVQVDDFVNIRASFHPSSPAIKHDIIINPKMSFGTGHHATTWLMMHQMQQINFDGKAVMDFGSGTGILAILAEKLGASSVIAIDNDDNCIENAKENIDLNHCTKISLSKAETVSGNADIILANINKNIILANMGKLSKACVKEGIILFSGLLKEDYNDIEEALKKNDIQIINNVEKENWICLLCSSS